MKNTVTWMLVVALGVFAKEASAQKSPPVIPEQNTTKGTVPSDESAKTGATKLLQAIASGAPERAQDFFFPLEPFERLKESWNPARYHKKLRSWFAEDIRKEHKRFASGNWELEGFEMGRCRWMAIGKEGNKIAYWSCRRSVVTATNGKNKRRFEIHTLINWGNNWYVTHLGPIRK